MRTETQNLIQVTEFRPQTPGQHSTLTPQMNKISMEDPVSRKRSHTEITKAEQYAEFKAKRSGKKLKYSSID